jgi:hypothetical protein
VFDLKWSPREVCALTPAEIFYWFNAAAEHFAPYSRGKR